MTKKTNLSEASKDKWLTVEEAAEYLGMGKTVLYTLTREGKIPAHKVGRKWSLEKDQLDAWMRTNQPVESFFLSLDSNIEDNEALREPQRDAYLRACGHGANRIQRGRNRLATRPTEYGAYAALAAT